MPPKTPSELREQLERENEDEQDETSKTAEGLEVPNPSRGEFFSNLEKASQTKPSDC